MAHASRVLRRKRRLKRELTLAYRGMDIALKQRDDARLMIEYLRTELVKKNTPIEDNDTGNL